MDKARWVAAEAQRMRLMNEARDRDIDCPLFNVLQRWVVEQFGVAPKDAKEYARNFMRNYWLVGDQKP